MKCLALPRADRNLLDAIQNERFAGINKVQVVTIVRDIALSLKEMHDHHLVHGDVKVWSRLSPCISLCRKRLAIGVHALSAALTRSRNFAHDRCSLATAEEHCARRRAVEAHRSGRHGAYWSACGHEALDGL